MSSPSPSELRYDQDARLPGAWSVVGLLVATHAATALAYAGAAGVSVPWAMVLNRGTRLRTLAGGQVEPLIAEEPWRLVRSVGLHADAGHLLVNAVAVLVLGRLLEPWIGGVRFVWWFALAGVGGSLASHAAGLFQSDGASGGAFGLLGAALVLGIRHRDALDPADRSIATRWLPAFVIGNLVLSAVLPFVDGVGHLGGLGVGCIAGALARPQPPGRAVTWCEAVGVGILVAIAAFGPVWTG